ncbi:S8 family serine peptidase [Natronolimnohabitans innermongolicus]|uniref:Peptidase S8/S53 subtilisin kexin sedolisin n=1 Tax=Natronolimnohabitans innermongolicus JCM 12255 TaxID=1227499 RepID=L9WVZ5_9EURY|nr:S8 family serine peptidase [Natronolimnohabitans innermongolicus]ELY53625.1 peptidase S8/S53 subtilisin kexin sedolisin [Natronolimnohabitans innermongolicus JCM 12255]
MESVTDDESPTSVGSNPSPTGTDPTRIDPGLEDADGVVDVIVRFETGGDGEAATNEATDASALQTASNQSQTSLEHVVETTDGLALEAQFWVANAALVTVDTDRVELGRLADVDGVAELHADDDVTLSRPAGESTDETTAAAATTSPTASAAGVGSANTYGLEQLSVPTVWDRYDARGEGATIAVLDTGVDATHPDLTVDEWRDFAGGSTTPTDYSAHGTHVAGSAVGGDSSGTHIGVAPEARLLAGAVLTDCNDEGCVGSTSDVIAGIEWAVDRDADVISLSLGSDGYSSTYVDAVRNAKASGTVVVGGAGNSGEGTSASPGNVYDAIGVGATDEYERVAGFSGGEVVDTDDAWGWRAPAAWPDSYVVPTVVAPGDRVYSSVPGDEYGYKRGTSMATPHVAGVIALLQGATDRTLEPAEIREAVTETATKPAHEPDGADTRYGHGIVDAAAALEAAGSFATVEGTVTDAVTDTPVAGATVTLEGDDGSLAETTTDSDGRYELEGVTGDREYEIAVSATGYESTAKTAFVPGDERTTVDTSVAGDGEVEVVLEDAQFGDGIESASVEVGAAAGSGDRKGAYPASDDGNGVYTIEDVPSDRTYTLAASATGYVDDQREVAVKGDAKSTSEQLELSGDATLEATVADSVTGAPIENATVTVERADGSTFVVDGSTGADGGLETPVPGAGAEYTVTVDAAGYETGEEVVTASSGETVDADVSMVGDGEFVLELEDAQFGDGVTDATVEAAGERGTYAATHDGEGTYRVEQVPSRGAYDVDVTVAGYADESLSMGFDDGLAVDERVVLSGDATLSVAVDDEDGDALADASVAVEREDGDSFDAGTTASDGTLEVVVPGTGAAYTVVADADGYESGTETTESVGSEETTSVALTLSAVDDGLPAVGVVGTVVALFVALALVARARR